jgi:hypothetical protein
MLRLYSTSSGTYVEKLDDYSTLFPALARVFEMIGSPGDETVAYAINGDLASGDNLDRDCKWGSSKDSA